MDDEPSLKGAWLHHVTHFEFGPIHISGMAEARIVKFCAQVVYIKSCKNVDTSQKGYGCGYMTCVNF